MFSVDRKITTLWSTIPVGNSVRLISHWNDGPSGWDFPVPTEHQWWILFVLDFVDAPVIVLVIVHKTFHPIYS